MDKKLAALVTFTALVLLIYPVKAQTEYVYVDLFFNIGAVDELSVTLLSESPVTSAAGGTATASNIEFNVSGDVYWQNATVTGGGSLQDDTNPILALDNTGTTNLEINISINSTLPSNGCKMDLRYINDTGGAPYDISGKTPGTDGVVVSTTNITINSSYTPSNPAIGLWLYGNFSGCGDADDTTRRFTMWARTV